MRESLCFVPSVAILVVWAFVPSGRTEEAQREAERYHDEEKGFSIRFPEGWQIKKGSGGTAVVALSPREGPGGAPLRTANVFIENMPLELDTGAYFRINLSNMGKVMTDFQEHEQGETTVDNQQAKWLVYSFSMGDLRLKVLVFVMTQGRRGYAVSCGTLAEAFSEHRAEFEKIAGSFKPEPVAAASAPRPLPTSGRYVNKDKGFSIDLPEGWERKEGFIGMTILALSPLDSPADGFRENVNVVVEEMAATPTPEQYFQAGLGHLKRVMTDFQEHERGQITIGETAARWLVYSQRTGNIKVKCLLYLLVEDDRGYVINCSAAPESFEKYRKTFEETAGSFRLE